MSALIGKSVDSVVQKMDVNAIVDKIDLNALLEKVDLDRLIERIDINAIVERIDLDDILERSNLEAIVARSSSGVLQQMIDLVRVGIVKLDLFVFRLSRCRCLMDDLYLPPRPRGRKKKQTALHVPGSLPRLASRQGTVRAVEVQGRYSGVVSRGASWVIDELFGLLTFFVAALFTESLIQLLSNDENYQIQGFIYALGLIVWSACIRFISLLSTTRTLGMFLLGLVLVSRDGRPPSMGQILLRQLFQPWVAAVPGLNMVFFVLAWIRSDGRFVHDLISCTGCAYRWDVRMARLRMEQKERARIRAAAKSGESVDQDAASGDEEDGRAVQFDLKE